MGRSMDWRTARAQAESHLSRTQRLQIERARARRLLQQFDPDEPRDESGRWTDGGGGDGGGSAKPSGGGKPSNDGWPAGGHPAKLSRVSEGDKVDGLTVLHDIPNTSSIDAAMDGSRVARAARSAVLTIRGRWQSGAQRAHQRARRANKSIGRNHAVDRRLRRTQQRRWPLHLGRQSPLRCAANPRQDELPGLSCHRHEPSGGIDAATLRRSPSRNQKRRARPSCRRCGCS